jgi:outer membrane protein
VPGTQGQPAALHSERGEVAIMMRARILLIGLSVLCGELGPAHADSVRYGLGECIKSALTAGPDMGAAAADLAGARAKLAQARAARWGEGDYHQVLGFVNAAHGTVNFPDPNTKKNDVFNGLGPFTRIEMELNIPLWTFGKLDGALKAAQEGLESERAGDDAKRAGVVLNTKKLYYGLLLSRQLGLVLEDMLDSMDKAVAKTKERLAAGSTNVTEIDLLKLQAGRARFAAGVLEVNAAAALARSALARAVGLEPTAEFDITDRKLVPVEAPIGPLDSYLTDGPNRRPEMRQLTSGVAAQAAKVDVERAGYYPNLVLTAGVRWAKASNRDEQQNPFAWDEFNFVFPVGFVGVHWDLNFLQTSAKVDQARADLERVTAQRRDANSGLQLEIQRAYGEVVQQRGTIRAGEDGRKAGRALMVLTVSNFDLGFGEAEELFKALGTYAEASSNYLRAVHDYNVAVGALSKAVGFELTNLQY